MLRSYPNLESFLTLRYLGKVDPGALFVTSKETNRGSSIKDSTGCSLESNPVHHDRSIASFARFHDADAKSSPSHLLCPYYDRVVHT